MAAIWVGGGRRWLFETSYCRVLLGPRLGPQHSTGVVGQFNPIRDRQSHDHDTPLSLVVLSPTIGLATLGPLSFLIPCFPSLACVLS